LEAQFQILSKGSAGLENEAFRYCVCTKALTLDQDLLPSVQPFEPETELNDIQTSGKCRIPKDTSV